VKIELENQGDPDDLTFLPGMFARVSLSVGSKEPVLLVPKDAVVLGGRSPLVYALGPMPEPRDPPPGEDAKPGGGPPGGASPSGPKPDGVARLVPVELGAAVDEMIEVRGALEPGDRVVRVGNERLMPGQPMIVIDE
jgi:multidrug efflux pump subunit AcrA (membrane-fusion protein)